MLRKQAKRLNLSLKHLTNMTQANVQNKISSAYKAYNLAKPKLPKWREEFQVSLVNALASAKDKSPKVIIAQMKRKKHQKLLGIKSRIIRQKHKNDPILQATATNEAGQVYECTDESEMVKAMAKSNLSRQQQSTSTPFMTEPLLTDFGYLANDKAAQEVLNGTYVPPLSQTATASYGRKFVIYHY